MQDLIGRSTGRYEIKSEIGSGGMAVVYLAHDANLDVDVAIKFIRTDKLTEENKKQALGRFKREAQKTAHLLHPNIVTVMDFGEFEGIPFLVMRFIPGGRTLKGMTGSPIPYVKVVDLIMPVVGALQTAHDQGIIHRDVKPSNILLTEQEIPMLSDFGIAKVLDTEGKSETLTSAGTTVGTPEYMAPEQWHDSDVDARADIYALGVVVYEMLTGRPPFKGRNTTGTMIAVLTEPLPPARNFAPDLPIEIAQVVEKALAKKPEDRFTSMKEFGLALQNAVVRAKASATPTDQPTIMGTVSGTVKQPVTPPITPPVTPIAPPQSQYSYIPQYSQPLIPVEQPKTKTGLWIVLGVVAVGFVIGAVLLLKTLIGGGPPVIDEPVTQTNTPFIENPVVVSPEESPTIPISPLGGITPEPTSTPTQVQMTIPDKIFIVMSNGPIGNSDIYLSNEDGSNFHCLACDQTCDETEPEWSPDGGSVVFQSNCGGSFDIWTVSASGGTPWQLTSESLMDEREPSWNIKDQIVYRVSAKDENIAGIGDIYVAEIKGTGYPIGFQGRSPVWSPDGTKIAYMSNAPGTWQIFVYDLNAGTKKQVSNCSTGCRFPVWSPDGLYIAYNLTDTASSTNPAGIGYVPVNGGVGQTLLTGYAGRPSWSVNGWIAYNTSKGIEAINFSSKQKMVVVDVASAWGPCWSK